MTFFCVWLSQSYVDLVKAEAQCICSVAAKDTHNAKTLSQSPRHLITYYLWYFADVAAYLLKKEVEKISLQVLFRLQVHIIRGTKKL